TTRGRCRGGGCVSRLRLRCHRLSGIFGRDFAELLTRYRISHRCWFGDEACSVLDAEAIRQHVTQKLWRVDGTTRCKERTKRVEQVQRRLALEHVVTGLSRTRFDFKVELALDVIGLDRCEHWVA